MFAATVRALVDGGYLVPTGVLSGQVTDDKGRVTEIPGEVAITEKAHAILDGWPGAAPEEIVETSSPFSRSLLPMNKIRLGSVGWTASRQRSRKSASPSHRR